MRALLELLVILVFYMLNRSSCGCYSGVRVHVSVEALRSRIVLVACFHSIVVALIAVVVGL